jgi:hypothetical protein
MTSTLKGKKAANERTPLLSQAGASTVGIDTTPSNPAVALPEENALSGDPVAGRAVGGAKPSRQVGPDMLRGVLMMFMAIGECGLNPVGRSLLTLCYLDHTSVSLGGYSHGQGLVSEGPATVITQFNETLPYILRSLSLCHAHGHGSRVLVLFASS